MKRIRLRRNPHCQPGIHGMFGDPQWISEDKINPIEHDHDDWSKVPMADNVESGAGDFLFDEDFHPYRTYENQSSSSGAGSSSSGTSSSGSSTTATTYKRDGKRLPFIRGGATDASAKAKSGIEGLVTEILKKMGQPVADKITDAQIKAFQKSKNLTDDGIIGKKTYTALGFQAPFPVSSSGGSSYNPTTDKDQTAGGESITDKVWFYPAVGVGTLTLLIVILRAMKKRKKKMGSPQMRMNRY